MPKLIEPKLLKGFRDFLPEAELEKKRIQAVLEKTFESFGFVPIDTPVLEYTEILLGKGGGETDKQMYRFNDNGGRDVAMRFDLTIPFARYVAAHRAELYLPFKRYHIAKVFRGENTQRGRYREFTQCDFDLVGCDTVSADFEILQVMRACMAALGAPKATIHLAHRGLFNRLIDRLGLAGRSADVLRTVDKLKKSGRDETAAALTDIAGRDRADELLEFIQAEADFGLTLEKTARLAGGEDEDTRRLGGIFECMIALGIQDGFRFDPSITRGLDYYTGLVFETFLDELPGIGSVCSGGRYNDLASLYTSERLPGVGSSIGLDRLMAALEELGRKSERRSPSQVVVFQLETALLGHYHKLAARLRERGFAAEVYPDDKKLPAQFAYAERKGIPFGLFCGAAEARAGTCNLRDLTGRVSYDGLGFEELAARLAAAAGAS